MSVGVCVANKRGIAIAVDSAVSSSDRGIILNSFEKLHPLSAKLPVAIALTGSINYMNIPIELVMAMYGQYLEQNKIEFSSLFAYIDDFIRYLEKQKFALHLDGNERSYIEDIVQEILDRPVDRTLRAILDKVNEAPPLSVVNKKQWFDDAKAELTSFKKLKWDSCVPYVLQNYGGLIKKLFLKDYHEAGLNEDEIQEWVKLIAQTLDTNFGNQETSIVFAGYGSGDFFPAYRAINILGMINGKVRWYDGQRQQISEEYPRSIYSFAQDEAISGFINGVDFSVQRDFQGLFFDFFNHQLKEASNPLLTSQVKTLIAELSQTWEDPLDDAFIEITEKRWDPVYSAVQGMPLKELGIFAENMVQIAILKSKYSVDRRWNQTVGGPVKTALINKISGFTWVHEGGK